MNYESNNNFLSSSSFHRSGFPLANTFTKDVPKSKAYLNAMRSLQEKIKELEKEKIAWLNEKQEIISTVENEYQEIMKQYRKEIEEYLTKEIEFKEKISVLEEKLLENEGIFEENDEKMRKINEENEKKLQGVNREIIEIKTRLQEEIQSNQDLKMELKDLMEKNLLINEENERNINDFKEEKGVYEEKLMDIESKYQGNLIELKELKTHYSLEINEYQEELLRIQGKYQMELEGLLQEKDQILLENRRLFNDNNLKDEDLDMFKRKFEALSLEKKKDDMYKQIINDFQLSRDNSAVFLRNPLENVRTTFPNNMSEILQKNKENREKSEESNSSKENSDEKDKKKEKSKKKMKKMKKKKEKSSGNNSEIEDLGFIKEKNMREMQDFKRNFKEILSLENDIKQTNQKYESLMLESQVNK